tara:strand:+ start:1417 stop:2202 length:786 start_codon:yes stop_codon:yes gene_type:complete
MNYVFSFLLGIIQGLTEFLPISSSGHLQILNNFFNFLNESEDNFLLTITLHFATCLSTIIIFKKRIKSLLFNLFKPKLKNEYDFLYLIFLSMIPAVIVGLFLDHIIELLFSGHIFLIGLMLLINSVILLVADNCKEGDKELNTTRALLIGVSQAIGIIPGISRSGITISTSILLGIKRNEASTFSFLMVIPLIIGSVIKSIIDQETFYFNIDFSVLLVGFFGAFFTGIIACKWMLYLVENFKLKYFSFYCIIVGIIALSFG